MASELDKVIGITYGASLSQGGWEATIRIAADGDALEDWQIVEIWQKDWWNSWTEGWNRVLKGYSLPKEIRRDWERGDFDALVATSHRMLRNMDCQYCAFVQDDAPSNNHEMVVLTIGKMIKHILDSHTNIIFDAVNNPEGWATYNGVSETIIGTFGWYGMGRERGLVLIWQLIAQLASAYELITFFTKDDDLYWDVHPMFKSPLPSKVVTFDTDFWYSIRHFRRGQEDRVRQAIVTGELDDGQTNIQVWPQFMYGYGTDWYYGHDVYRRVRCNDPTELLGIAQRMQKFANRTWDLEIETWGLWDLELADRVGITYVNAEDGIDWDNKDFYVESIRVSLDWNDSEQSWQKRSTIRLNEGVS